MFPYNNAGYFPYPQTFSYEQPETIYYQGRAFVRPSDTMPSSTWIERGPDGRGYYVKKKAAVPSLRKQFAEAFHDFRQRSRQVNSTSQKQPSKQTTQNSSTAPNSNSNQQSKSQPDMTNQNKDVVKAGQNAQSQAYSAYHPGHPQFQAFNPYQYYQYAGAAYNPAAFMSNPYAPYHRPFPGMSAAFHQPSAIQAVKSPTVNSTTMAQAQVPVISAPQPDLTTAGPPNANNLAMSQMITNPDGLKFKCMICERFRSSRYHLNHRLAPGQLPGPTICRRCRRRHTTDSEDETSDSEGGDLLYRSRSTIRNRSRSRSRSRLPRAGSRARSSGRLSKRREDFDYYALHSPENSSSGSEESVSDKFTSRRAKSVRYVDEPHPTKRARSKKRRVVYVQEPDDQSELSDDEVEVRYIKQAPEHVVVRGRPGTPALPGTLKHLHNEISQPVYVEQRVYYDEPPASFSGNSMPPPEFNTRNPYRNVPMPQAEQYLAPPGHTPQPHQPFHPVPARIHASQPDPQITDHSRFGYKNGPSIPYAPTPPMLHRQRSRSRSRDTERGIRSIEHVKERKTRARSISRGRRRSSSRSFSEQYEPPADDYDWYDAEGMKVRVREI